MRTTKIEELQGTNWESACTLNWHRDAWEGGAFKPIILSRGSARRLAYRFTFKAFKNICTDRSRVAGFSTETQMAPQFLFRIEAYKVFWLLAPCRWRKKIDILEKHITLVVRARIGSQTRNEESRDTRKGGMFIRNVLFSPNYTALRVRLPFASCWLVPWPTLWPWR